MSAHGFSASGRLIPDSVYAARAFSIDEDGWLTSISATYIWAPGWNVARCTYAPFGHHLGTDRSRTCGCGFWAYWNHTGEYVASAAKRQDGIAGIIEGKGRARVGNDGLRIEHAQIVALVDTHPLVYRFHQWFMPVYLVGWLTYYMVLLVLSVSGDADGSPWMYGLLTAAFTALVWFMLKHRLYANPRRKIEARYPGVTFYPSWKAALKDYPVQAPAWKDGNKSGPV